MALFKGSYGIASRRSPEGSDRALWARRLSISLPKDIVSVAECDVCQGACKDAERMETQLDVSTKGARTRHSGTAKPDEAQAEELRCNNPIMELNAI